MIKLNYLKILFLTIVTLLMQMVISFLFPAPFNNINAIAVFLVLMLLKHESGALVWLAFFIYFIVDLYSGSFFGATIIAGTLALLISYWLYKYLFTNKSLLAVATVASINIILHEIFFYTIILVTAFFASTNYSSSVINITKIVGIKLFLTVGATVLWYMVSHLRDRRAVYFFSPK